MSSLAGNRLYLHYSWQALVSSVTGHVHISVTLRRRGMSVFAVFGSPESEPRDEAGGSNNKRRKIVPQRIEEVRNRVEVPDPLLERIASLDPQSESEPIEYHITLTEENVTNACVKDVDFAVRESDGKGLGLFALRDIPAGKVITAYGGSVINAPPEQDTHTLRVLGNLGDTQERYIDAIPIQQLWISGKHDEAYELGVGGLCNSCGPPDEPGAASASCTIAWTDKRKPYLYTIKNVPKDTELLLAYRWKEKAE